MKILIVLTSHDQLGNTGKKTGFWLEDRLKECGGLYSKGAENKTAWFVGSDLASL